METNRSGAKLAEKRFAEKARIESQATFEKTKENLALEIAKARISLRREIADLAISVGEKVLQEKLDGAKQQEKVLELLNELEKKS